MTRGCSRASVRTESAAAASSSVNCGLEPVSAAVVGERVAGDEHGRVGIEHRDVASGVAGGGHHLQPEHVVPVGHGAQPPRCVDRVEVGRAGVQGRAARPVGDVAQAADVVGMLVSEHDMAYAGPPGPASSSTAPIWSALPPTPVSTTAASAPRTSTYADTNPRSTRDQASAAPSVALLARRGGRICRSRS